MPRTTPPTLPPSSDRLRAFFRAQRTQPVADAAALLGWSRAEVQRRGREEDALRRGMVRWEAVAAWLFEAWSYEGVMDALGPETSMLPLGMQAVPVLWYAPLYLVHGLNVQRRMEPLTSRTTRTRDLSDYLTDRLHRELDPDTVSILRADPEFRRSYALIDGGDDADA